MSETAVHPTQHPVVKTFKAIQEDKTEIDKQSDKDRLLADLNGDPRYEVLKEQGYRMIKQLETMQGQIESTDTPETIGFRFLACSIAVTKIQELLQIPENIVVSSQVNDTK